MVSLFSPRAGSVFGFRLTAPFSLLRHRQPLMGKVMLIIQYKLLWKLEHEAVALSTKRCKISQIANVFAYEFFCSKVFIYSSIDSKASGEHSW